MSLDTSPPTFAPEPNPDPVVKAAVLAQALPYMRRYAGHTLVVKYGGHAMADGISEDSFARDVVLLKQVGINPIVVHGGGPQIAHMLKRLGIETRIVDGLRVTDGETMEVVEMVLAGTINKQLVSAINAEGGCAIGLTGKDGGLIEARKLVRTRIEGGVRTEIDFGFVGEPQRIASGVLDTFKQSDIIPVIAPIGVGATGRDLQHQCRHRGRSGCRSGQGDAPLAAHRRRRGARCRQEADRRAHRRQGAAADRRRRHQWRHDPQN